MSRILLELSNVVVTFGDRTVLNLDRLSIREGERIGLIGENGAGKSTLLAVLAGNRIPDSGRVQRHCPVAVIRQQGDGANVDDARLRSNFGVPEAHDGLSGGELTRRRVVAALSVRAPLLLADEPTTDLDAAGIARLREHLARYEGALVLVSHDRALLNALCGRIWHLEDGHIADFPGDYDAWQAERERRRGFQQFEYDQYRAETARLKEAARRKAELAAQVRRAPKRMGNSEARLHTREYTDAVLALSHESRTLKNRLEHLEVKERPRDLPDIRMALGAFQPIAAKIALEACVKSLRACGRTLLYDARFALPTGSRTALTGPNGCGKTTLLRCLLNNAGDGTAFSGSVRLNPAARVGVFDQDHARTLDMERTALENAMLDSDLPQSECRTVLARLNLRGDQVFKRASVLSGGERARVALAKLLLGRFNLLVLDEPTNHLDLFTLEALQGLLAGYGGTLLFVSHDMAFVEAVATRIVRFEGAKLTTFEGTLSQLEAEQHRDKTAEARELQISALEMRLAALAARLAQPKKGDSPEALSAEYDEIANQLYALKK